MEISQEKSIPGKEKSNFQNAQVEPCLEHVSSEEATVCTGKQVEEMSKERSKGYKVREILESQIPYTGWSFGEGLGTESHCEDF